MHVNFVKISVLLVAAAAVLVGCGGSDDETTLTKAQIIEQGDAICKKADADQVRILGRLNREKSFDDRTRAEQGELVTGAGMAPILRQAEELAELPAPEGDAEEIEAMAEAIEASVKRARENPELVLGTNPLAVFEAGAKAAEAYGFKLCSEVL